MSADSVQSKVASAILNALGLAKKNGLINCQLPEQIILDRPKNRDHGDYATSIALTLAKAANLQPRVIAEVIIKTLDLLAHQQLLILDQVSHQPLPILYDPDELVLLDLR